MPAKRDWITRMVDLFNKMELGILYNKTNVRDFLKDRCGDSISLPTVGELLDSIIEAEKKGLIFKVNDKFRKLIEKKTASEDSLYELIEGDTINLNGD